MFRTRKIRLPTAKISGETNHRVIGIEITGAINIREFKSAFDLLIARHEILRSYVVKNEIGFYLNIHPAKKEKYSSHEIPLKIFINTNLNSYSNVENFYQTLKNINEEKFFDQDFNTSKGPLWRAALIKVADEKFQFFIEFSNIIFDPAFIEILLKDLSFFYNILLDVEPENNAFNLPSFLSDLEKIDSEEMQKLEYWQDELKDLNTISLQTDFAPAASPRLIGASSTFEFDSDLISRILSNTQLKSYSLDKIILSVFYSLLYRYSTETDICLGIHSPAYFSNLIPLRLNFSAEDTLLDLLKKMETALENALNNQLPIDIISQKALSDETKSSLITTLPFNITFALHEIKNTLTLANTQASYPVELDLKEYKSFYVDINVNLYPDNSCKGFIRFNSDLFSKNTIEHFSKRFKQSLNYIAHHPQTRISMIPLLLDDEKALINEFNNTEKLPIGECLVHDFFHQRALNHPSEIFLVYHEENGDIIRLTYEEVDSQSTQLANYLIKFGAGPNVPIGVCLNRSPKLIIAILAALKTGGILVTVETEKNQIFDLKIEELEILVIDNQTQTLFTDSKKQLINIKNETTLKSIHSCSNEYHSPNITSQHPAYIMYTSGTTGKPKGVVSNHIGFANLLDSLRYDMNFQDYIKIICTTSPTFDAFLYDILVAISVIGGQFHITFEQGRFSPKVLENIIRNEKINFGVFLPDLLDYLDPDLPLKYIITMGAPPHPDTIKKWLDAYRGKKQIDYRRIYNELKELEDTDRIIWNGLGDTEGGICLCLCLITEDSHPNLIGRPIRNMKTIVLDPATLSICPPNIPGERYVAGVGLAQGYLKNEQVTAQKFLEVIFNAEKNAFEIYTDQSDKSKVMRIYKSGDVVCYQMQNNSINVKFIGRNDKQIKIYGVRIELDNIETLLRNIPIIKDVVVIPNESKTALTAYVVPAKPVTDEEIDKQIREYFAKILLPSVACPKNIITLTEIPVTKNGKVDTRKLQSMKVNSPDVNLKENLTDLQKKLKQIWAQVLGKPESSFTINQTFSSLGGNSLDFARLERMVNNVAPSISYKLSKLMTIDSLSQQLNKQTTPINYVKQGQVIFSPTQVVFFPSKKFKSNMSDDTSPSLSHKL